jgi:hypothetical protein
MFILLQFTCIWYHITSCVVRTFTTKKTTKKEKAAYWMGENFLQTVYLIKDMQSMSFIHNMQST